MSSILEMFESFNCRAGLFSRERAYTVTPKGLEWSAGSQRHLIDYASIERVRFRRTLRHGPDVNRKSYWLCSIKYSWGLWVNISPLHYERYRIWEDRSHQFGPMIRSFLNELKRVNPKLEVTFGHGRYPLVHRLVGSCGSLILVILVKFIRVSNRENISRFFRFATRKIGPYLRAHRVGRANLIAAFPEKSSLEIDRILAGVWDNLGRLPVEFAFIDRLWDFDLEQGAGHRILIDPVVTERIRKLKEKGGPALCFGAHFANWEMPALAASAMGFKSAMVFRTPDSRKLADEVLRLREKVMGKLIPAGPAAAMEIYRALRQGCIVGMLADQHSAGVAVKFFGRECMVSAALGRLARQFDCPIYGARSIRLPDGRFMFELTEAIEPSRDADGKIDVTQTMQTITSVIEGWVREQPEQWLWLHRRWR
jgi:Kdo2-lipid IVA lauroyltransferase/acyltransferase